MKKKNNSNWEFFTFIFHSSKAAPVFVEGGPLCHDTMASASLTSQH